MIGADPTAGTIGGFGNPLLLITLMLVSVVIILVVLEIFKYYTGGKKE